MHLIDHRPRGTNGPLAEPFARELAVLLAVDRDRVGKLTGDGIPGALEIPIAGGEWLAFYIRKAMSKPGGDVGGREVYVSPPALATGRVSMEIEFQDNLKMTLVIAELLMQGESVSVVLESSKTSRNRFEAPLNGSKSEQC